MAHFDSFDKIIFLYDTGPIPPPFCYKYSIEISIDSSDNFFVDLGLSYYDRDDITEEELFDEGFSLEDDFQWSGSLPNVWGKDILKKLRSANWRKKISPDVNGSEFKVKIMNLNQSEILRPSDTKQWEIFMQEIIQAIFELAAKEAPLIISFSTRASEEEIDQADFEFSFAHKTIRISNQKNSQKSMEWEEGQKLLKYIFGFDYLPEHASEKVPKPVGNYISPGDGWWYELFVHKNASEDAKEKVSRLIDTLIGYTN